MGTVEKSACLRGAAARHLNSEFLAMALVHSFQRRVLDWTISCFGPEIAADKIERNHRFLEEALELVQSLGCTANVAHQLVDYVYSRPAGEAAQELGGVMVTLAALSNANDLNIQEASETELSLCYEKIEKIRTKHAAKPKYSPLPGAT